MSTYSTLQNAEQATEIREEVLKPKHVTPNLIPVNEISKYGGFILGKHMCNYASISVGTILPRKLDGGLKKSRAQVSDQRPFIMH